MNYSMMKGTRLKEVLQNTTPKPQRPISKGKKRSVLVNFISKLTSHFAQNPAGGLYIIIIITNNTMAATA